MIQTSLSNIVLMDHDLLLNWSINKTKRHFNYLTTDNTIRMTFWIGLPLEVSYGRFKSTIMQHLQQEKTWIEIHPLSIAYPHRDNVDWLVLQNSH